MQTPTAERRQITVLFCDLVGSTALSERLDPEDLRDVVRQYQSCAGEVVRRFEGHVAQYLGDGILIYFGYPVAHEDDARRAILTALGIRAAVGELSPCLSLPAGIQLEVRLGGHTGTVVTGEVGDGARRENLALGQTPNIAARLQAIAEPGSVVVSATMHRLTRDHFDFEPLGEQTLRGVSQPIEAFSVLGERLVESALERRLPEGLTPLVGRDSELDLLRRSLGKVREGHGQIVTIAGEPGIGKTRLIQMFRERFASVPCLVCRCSPYFENSAFSPIVDLLVKVLGFQRDDAPETRLRKLREELERRSPAGVEGIPLIAELLGIPFAGESPFAGLSPQRRKEKTLDFVAGWILSFADAQPTVLVVEDLHWIDPSSLDLLKLLLERSTASKLLVLASCRPAFEIPWRTLPQAVEIVLDRLSDEESKLLIQRVTGGRALPPAILEQILDKTDGVPLFVEELTKALLESYEAAGSLSPIAIPATLQDSLTARLDKLTTAKTVAQLGSVIGRQFTFEMLQAASRLHDLTLRQEMARLVAAGLLYERGRPPQAIYTFKHALVQDAAYASLLKSTRREYHRIIAEVILARFAELAATRPEILAHHFSEAELYGPAIGYWQQAGSRALERSANVEAIGHFSQGLTLLERLPADSERDATELALRSSRGSAMIAVEGYASPRVERDFARAQTLCDRAGQTPHLFWVLWGLFAYRLVRGDTLIARHIGHQLLEAAALWNEPSFLLEAYADFGCLTFCCGELATSAEYMNKGLSLDLKEEERTGIKITGQDAEVTLRVNFALGLWLLGRSQEALHQSLQGIARARTHPHSLAIALTYSGFLHYFIRNTETIEELCRELIEMCQTTGFFWSSVGKMLLGWAQVTELRRTGAFDRAQATAALHLVRSGHDEMQAIGSGLMRTVWTALMGEVCMDCGELAEARLALDSGLAHCQKTGERFWEAELIRLRGELALRMAALDPSVRGREEAEARFREALGCAERQGAKALELRVALSLGRLLPEDEAARRVSALLCSFDQGLDDPDLVAARAFLASGTFSLTAPDLSRPLAPSGEGAKYKSNPGRR